MASNTEVASSRVIFLAVLISRSIRTYRVGEENEWFIYDVRMGIASSPSNRPLMVRPEDRTILMTVSGTVRVISLSGFVASHQIFLATVLAMWPLQ